MREISALLLQFHLLGEWVRALLRALLCLLKEQKRLFKKKKQKKKT